MQNFSNGVLSFAIIEIALVMVPILLYFHSSKLVKYNLKKVLIPFYFFILIACIFWLNEISFKYDVLDTIAFVIIYSGYLFPLIYTYKIKKILTRISVQVLLFAPVVFGIAFGTLGILGLMMAMFSQSPNKIIYLNDDIYYKEYFVGGPLLDVDYIEIKTYKQLHKFDFLEKNILNSQIDIENYNDDTVNVNFEEYSKYYKIDFILNDNIVLDTLINK
jgi:hypothetical protein